MHNSVIFECLRHLIKVYVYAEEQYVQAASEATAPILRNFFEQRALERMDFIDEIYSRICPIRFTYSGKTVEELYNWHRQIYGNTVLNRLAVADIDYIIIDEKAEEICVCLLNENLPGDLEKILRKQLIKIEASILSILYLRTLHKN